MSERQNLHFIGEVDMNLFSEIINSIIQIILFALIPFIWWFVTARKDTGFMQWIGLKRFSNIKENKVLIWTTWIALVFMASGAITLYLLKGVEMATSEFAGNGAQAIPAIIIYAMFNTALPEELLFRGFLLKRLNCKFDFGISNTIQAVLFGLLHGIMFFTLVGIVKAILIIVLTSTIAWFMGYINEKKADGSIIPSWIIHTTANIFSGLCSAFLLI